MIGIVDSKRVENPTGIEDVYEKESVSNSFQRFAKEMLKYDVFTTKDLIEMFEAEYWVNLCP